MDSGNHEIGVGEKKLHDINEQPLDLIANTEKQISGPKIDDPKDSFYLTASELINLRLDSFKQKSKDEDFVNFKGQKLYASTSSEDEQQLMSLLNNYKSSLQLQRATKLKDCMKAEWHDDLKVSIVQNLKGKTTQHMGHSYKGKIALSPEESLFLLEKSAIEIKCNNMPLSIEEAYAVMLTGKLGLEKYQVYSHLSQQGFIVVHHQSRDKLKNRETSRKRKTVNGSLDEPEEKRTTFSGVLSSNSVQAEKSTSSECEAFPSNNLNVSVPKDNSESIANDAAFNDRSSMKLSDVAPDSSNRVASVDFGDQELLITPASSTELQQVDSLKGSIGMKICSYDKSETALSDAHDLVKENIQLSAGVSDSVPYENEKSNTSVKVASLEIDAEPSFVLPDKIFISQEDKISEFCEEVQANTDLTASKSNENVAELTLKEICTRRINEIYDEDTYSSDLVNDDYEASDDSMPVVCEESQEDLDVISCSASDQQNSCDFESRSRGVAKSNDDDVTLVEVKKKDKAPLAVIDLLSDEDVEVVKENEEMFEVSDDEIQVLKVCSNATNRACFKSSCSVKSESKANLVRVKGDVEVKSYQPQMQFPNLFRKDVYCVSRPSVTLLPNHVRPAKEVYVINCKKPQKNQGRVWESFRDLQDYQRDRRLQRQLNYSSPGPLSMLRDYRIRRDTGPPPRPNSFNPEEYFAESDFERNNHDFGFRQNRDQLHQPMQINHSSHSPLLSLPDAFGSPNHAPFMNVQNMHDMPNPNPAFIVNEIHRTIQSVTSNIIQRTIQSVANSFLGSHMNHFDQVSRNSPTFHPPSLTQPRFNYPSSSPMISESPSFNPVQPEFHPVHFPDEPTFSGERSSYGMNRDMQFDSWTLNAMRRKNADRKGPLFPRAYKEVRRKRCWSDIKATAEKSSDQESDSGSDIEEVPINLNQFLWTNEIHPLVKPGSKLPASEVLQRLRITQNANLSEDRSTVSCLPDSSALEISFDVYLPGFKFKKTDPGVPKLRIIVLRSNDPIPRYSKLVYLQRKFRDSAILQMAVVDHGDISFYSFNSISVPDLVPFEN